MHNILKKENKEKDENLEKELRLLNQYMNQKEQDIIQIYKSLDTVDKQEKYSHALTELKQIRHEFMQKQGELSYIKNLPCLQTKLNKN